MATELLNKFRCRFTRPRHLVGGFQGVSESREWDHKLDGQCCYQPMARAYVDNNAFRRLPSSLDAMDDQPSKYCQRPRE